MGRQMARLLPILLATLASTRCTHPVYLYEGSSCNLKNGRSGVCRSVNSCPSAVRELQKNHHAAWPSEEKTGYPRCGFDSFTEIVCCPETDNIVISNPLDDSYPFPDNDSSKTSITSKIGGKRKADIACDDYSKEVPSPLELYILGGEAAKQGEFPHMAALGYQRDTGIEFGCGGTLISALYVMTAAHCVVTVDGIKPTVIRIGTISLTNAFDTSDTDYPVEKIIVHPEYRRALKYHDIALIKLAKSVIYTGDAHPACLYSSDDDPTDRLIVTGWGQTSLTSTDSKSKTLLKANLTAVSIADCNPTYIEHKDRKLPNGLMADQFCAVDRGGTMDSCAGDSGGPIQIGTKVDSLYKIVGVTSFGKGCGAAIPAIYTRVSKYLTWIESIVWP